MSLMNSKRPVGNVAVSNSAVKGFRKLSGKKRLQIAQECVHLMFELFDDDDTLARLDKYFFDHKTDEHGDWFWRCRKDAAKRFGVCLRGDLKAGTRGQLSCLISLGLLPYK